MLEDSTSSLPTTITSNKDVKCYWYEASVQLVDSLEFIVFSLATHDDIYCNTLTLFSQMLFIHSKILFVIRRIIIFFLHKLYQWYWPRYQESTTVFESVTQSFFDTRKTLYLKESAAKPLKRNLKDDDNTHFVVI